MELFDAIQLIVAAALIGFIAGHHFTKRSNFDYERGKCDGISLMWPYLVRSWIDNLTLAGKSTNNKEAGASSSDNQAV
jgi:hypothetical protein